jgi:hypothetical protein
LSDWAIPGRVWTILLAWGLGILMIFSLLSLAIWRNQRQQDRDMCTMIGVFLSGPEPVAGPAGERSRTVRTAMRTYYSSRGCPSPR